MRDWTWADWFEFEEISGTDAESLRAPLESDTPGWAGLPMSTWTLPGAAEMSGAVVAQPLLVIARSGRGKRTMRRGVARGSYSAPKMFEVYEQGYGVDHCSWEGVPGELLGIQFPAALVNRLLQQERRGFDFSNGFELFDDRVATLTSAMWAEARAGAPNGKLYAQGLSLALLGLLLSENHGNCQLEVGRGSPGLSSVQRSRVSDYIETHLARQMSIDELAVIAGMSADRFSRAFRTTFERAPYAYVNDRRMERACQLMRLDPHLSLADVADSVGFSNQSHFTDAFKRRTGVSPGRWRSTR